MGDDCVRPAGYGEFEEEFVAWVREKWLGIECLSREPAERVT